MTAAVSPIDVVLPLVAGDLPRARILFASLRRFWRCPDTRLWVVVRDEELPLFRDVDAPAPFEVVAESRVLGSRFDDVSGWFRQQAIKLGAARLVRGPFYLVVDADCFAVKPIAPEDLVDVSSHRARVRYVRWIDPRWYEASRRLLGVPRRPPESVDFTPFVFHRDSVLALLDHLDRLERADLTRRPDVPRWSGLLMPDGRRLTGQWDDREWTEFTLYHVHGWHTGTWDRCHVPGDSLVRNTLWKEHLAPWIAADSFAAPAAACFSVVQSNTGVSVEWLWDQVRPWIE